MGKLHELLSVEGDLQGTAKKLTEEATKTFSKPEHFRGMHRHLEMFDASQQAAVVADEHSEMVTTVYDKLDYLSKAVSNYYDAVFQKELTNQVANSDLIVDGVLIAKNVPATFLLGLESKLKDLRQVYESTPTLAPGIAWDKDETLGKGVYRMRNPEEKLKTAKTFMHKVLYEATDKHAAQIEKWEEQIPVGKYITTVTSSMLSPADKSVLLGRIDKLIQAVKKSRMKANMVDTRDEVIGARIFEFINTGI